MICTRSAVWPAPYCSRRFRRSDRGGGERNIAGRGGRLGGRGPSVARGWNHLHEEARAFERKTGIASVGAKGLFKRWMKKEDRLESKDVLVVERCVEVRRQTQGMDAVCGEGGEGETRAC